MTRSSNRNRSAFFIRATKIDLLDPWKMDDNERVRHSLVNCTCEERAEPRDRAGQKQGVLPPPLMRSCIVHAEATYFTRVSAASKIGERCRRIS